MAHRPSPVAGDFPEHHPGPMLQQHRVNLGLTVTEAAKLCNMSPGTWSRYERGEIRYPEWATVIKMMAGLGMTLDWCFGTAPKLDQLHV